MASRTSQQCNVFRVEASGDCLVKLSCGFKMGIKQGLGHGFLVELGYALLDTCFSLETIIQRFVTKHLCPTVCQLGLPSSHLMVLFSGLYTEELFLQCFICHLGGLYITSLR